MERTVRVLRVFTRDGDGGNLLGVHDGLLDDTEMQAVAAALRFSETIFLGPSSGDATPVRIFTPQRELPFAGHPLVGAAWHAADVGSTISLACGVGPVTGHRLSRERASIEVTYLPPVEPAAPPSDAVAAWVARMPVPYELHRLDSPAAVAHYSPADEPGHRLVWAPGDNDRADTVRARFFAFESGIAEDPATGSAAVALAAVLRHEGQAEGSLTIHQGAEMGSPSRIDLSWTERFTVVGGDVVEDGARSVDI